MIDESRFQAIVLHIGNSPFVNNLGMTKLWKLIYFADVAAMRARSHSLTGSEFIKYEHGPVPSKGDSLIRKMQKEGKIEVVQEVFNTYRINRIVAKAPAQDHVFVPEEIALIDEVLQVYGQQTAAYLSELSHREPAWHYAADLQKLEPTLMMYGSEEDPEGL